jgi:hypothetical protein
MSPSSLLSVQCTDALMDDRNSIQGLEQNGTGYAVSGALTSISVLNPAPKTRFVRSTGTWLLGALTQRRSRAGIWYTVLPAYKLANWVKVIGVYRSIIPPIRILTFFPPLADEPPLISRFA